MNFHDYKLFIIKLLDPCFAQWIVSNLPTSSCITTHYIKFAMDYFEDFYTCC